jgi:alkylated DNA repair dioxygenase AlkB
MNQQDLFAKVPSNLPPGLRYQPGLIDELDAGKLTALIEKLPFKAFEFHGFTAKRRTVSFGWKYDFSAERLRPAGEMPSFLEPLRDRAAAFAGMKPETIEHALITEYQRGAAIGWHKDKAVFAKVVGISFGSACTMRFRKQVGSKWDRRSLTLEPGSAYLIDGPARSEWEHSIPPVAALRYSVTFRTRT